MIEIGVITKKKITPITIGLTKFPKKIPNLNHNLFNGDKIFEFINPNTKKAIETNKDQYLISPVLKKNQKAIIKKNKEKTIPKLLLLDLFLISIYCEFKLSITFIAIALFISIE